MLKHIVIGGSLAFAAVVQPGPFQAYLLSRVTAFGWRRTLPASFAPLLSDGPIAVLALLVLGQLSTATQSALRLAGGVLLIYLARGAFQQWRRRNPNTSSSRRRVPRTLYEAALVNVMNPNPYLGWSLVLGPIVVTSWNEAPSSGVAVVVAFYATMVTMLAFQICLLGSARFLGPRIQQILQLISSLMLAVLGIYQIVKGVQHFVSP
jgi:threonine/homoserine/homoserine lactone efflux protein